jgi:hypothetical protein
VRVRTIEQAAAWIEDVGVALLFPNADYVLPSLWEAVSGEPVLEWAVRDDDGKFVSFTPEMDKVWSWKDELPAQRLACVGLHVARTSSLVAPALVAAAYALTERRGAADDFRDAGLEGLELEVAEAALELGRPTTRRELRLLLGADKRTTDKAVNALQRKLVLTNAGLADERGWASTLHDLFARRWRTKLRRLPPREEAVCMLAAAIVRGAGEVSAADLGAALRLRRREATETLEALEATGLAEPRREADVTLWISPARAAAARARAPSARSRAAGSRSSPRRSP